MTLLLNAHDCGVKQFYFINERDDVLQSIEMLSRNLLKMVFDNNSYYCYFIISPHFCVFFIVFLFR